MSATSAPRRRMVCQHTGRVARSLCPTGDELAALVVKANQQLADLAARQRADAP